MQLIILLLAIFIGARIGGIGMGIMGGIGLFFLIFVLGLKPGQPPIDVMLIILSVISASAALQASKGLEYMVVVAEKILKKNPKNIIFLSPLIFWFLTLLSGTGFVTYSLMPVVVEVAVKTGIRPERPLSVSVIASQTAIVASPIAAAMVSMLSLLGPEVEMTQILKVTVPATLAGILLASFAMLKYGKELKNDPVYQAKLKDPEFINQLESLNKLEKTPLPNTAKISVIVFLLGVLCIVFYGFNPDMRPSFDIGNKTASLSMVSIIEIIMLCITAVIVLFCNADINELASGSVFRAGASAIVTIFGVAWMSNTFIFANESFFRETIGSIVQIAPWTFVFAVLIMSIILFSQAASAETMLPLGLALGISTGSLIAMAPAFCGFFVIPSYPTILAAVGFDFSGTTRIGKYVFNHSFMLSGLTALAGGVVTGFLINAII